MTSCVTYLFAFARLRCYCKSTVTTETRGDQMTITGDRTPHTGRDGIRRGRWFTPAQRRFVDLIGDAGTVVCDRRYHTFTIDGESVTANYWPTFLALWGGDVLDWDKRTGVVTVAEEGSR